MREIKFRVWDTKLSQMHMVNNILFSDGVFTPERVTAHFENGQYNISGKIDGGRDDSFKLMQFTGLKDKNSVEIYEGDLLDIKSAGYYFGVFAVKWDDNGFWDYGFSTEDSAVIGNIYENPELLEANQ